MDSLLLEYGWTLLILIGLEGILSADNALVMAVMVKHLPEDKQKKALYYGVAGAIVFRFGALFLISFLVHVWQVQAIGAIYLVFLGIRHIWKKFKDNGQSGSSFTNKKTGFWQTVFLVNVADLVFAIDSILAAVALAVALPETPLPTFGGMDGGHFIVILLGGIIGLIIIRIAAGYFVKLLEKRPNLETAAYAIVAWVGVKLMMHTVAHPDISWIPESFTHSLVWKLIFYGVLLGIAVAGWFLSSNKEEEEATKNEEKEKASSPSVS